VNFPTLKDLSIPVTKLLPIPFFPFVGPGLHEIEMRTCKRERERCHAMGGALFRENHCVCLMVVI
jgi:hypothetical protein